eukprot:NODE_51_length_27121_cov_0.309452.p8 type:complete len:216 gc:universal NODE_51_length_27121_cov_0.309452:7235-7882(+)
MLEFIMGMFAMMALIIFVLYTLLFIYGSKTPLRRVKQGSIHDNIILNDTIHKTLHGALNVLLTNIAKQYLDKIHLDIPFIKEFNMIIDWDGFIECTNMTTNSDFSIFTLVVHPPLLIQVQGNLFYNSMYLPFVVDIEPMCTLDVGLDVDTTVNPDGSTHSRMSIQLIEYQLDLSISSSIGGIIKLKNVDKLHKLMEYLIRDNMDKYKRNSIKINI